MEGFNHSSRGQWLGVKQGVITMGPGTIKRSHCSDNGEDKLEQLETKRYLPVEKYPYLLLRFNDSYTYFIYT